VPNESWYVLVGGQQYGPYPLAAMEQFVAEGRVTPQTMVRQGETGGWATAGQMLDFSHAPASAGGSGPGGFPPAGPLGYAPPPRSSRNTWVIPVVVGGVCLALFVMCLGLPMAFFFLRFSAARHELKKEYEEMRRTTEQMRQKDEQMRQKDEQVWAEVRKKNKQIQEETKKAKKDLENKRKEIEAKARSPLDEPAVKPDGPKTPVEAEPEPRSP
jgi:flagellar biosynthesis GTPase FlhF